MTRVVLSQRALADIERFIAHLVLHDSPNATRVAGVLERGLRLLTEHPLIGRPRGPLRELTMGRPPTNYVALYEYDALTNTVTVHALKHQREKGYR